MVDRMIDLKTVCKQTSSMNKLNRECEILKTCLNTRGEEEQKLLSLHHQLLTLFLCHRLAWLDVSYEIKYLLSKTSKQDLSVT